MTHDEAPRFLRALAVLAEAMGESVSEERGMAYFQALEDLPLPECEAAIRLALEGAKWFPKPVELRAHTSTGALTGGEVYQMLVALKRRSPLRLKGMTPFLEYVVACLGGEAVFLDATDDVWLRKRCEDYAQEWQDVCRVRGIPTPTRQTRPLLEAPTARQTELILTTERRGSP